MSSIVYRTENKINGKFYYGVYNTKRNRHDYLGSGLLLKKAIKKYGRDNFIRRTIMEFDNDEDAYDLERLIVNQDFVDREDCYNLKIGGLGSRGLKWTDEQKLQRSKAYAGNKNPYYGKKHSEEVKHKMRYGNARNRAVVIDGIKYESIHEASRQTGIAGSTIHYRLNTGTYASE